MVGSNFEAINEGSLMVNIDSGQAVQTSGVTLSVSPSTATLSASQTQQFQATVTGSTLGVIWSLDTSGGLGQRERFVYGSVFHRLHADHPRDCQAGGRLEERERCGNPAIRSTGCPAGGIGFSQYS